MSHHAPAGMDPELAAILPAITGTAGEFRHRQHIHLTFWAIRQYGMPAAAGKICTWLRHITVYANAPQKYNQTVSRAWVELVAHHVSTDPDCADFAAFAARNPMLLDKRLLSRHYRSVTLASTRARQDWVEPDLTPFPWTSQGNAGTRSVTQRQDAIHNDGYNISPAPPGSERHI